MENLEIRTIYDYPIFTSKWNPLMINPTPYTWWKTKCLSFAGRLILVRHVLSSFPLYISLVLPLPSKTYLLIERMMRNFLLSANQERLKSKLVRWEIVYLPSLEGGLGLRKVMEFNHACLLKVACMVSYFCKHSLGQLVSRKILQRVLHLAPKKPKGWVMH